MEEKKVRYDESSIKVLKGLDAVRKRPAMYIGNTEDITGLHQMIFEVIDNSVDESLAGYCDEIKIILHRDGSAQIEDNGRGMPIGMHVTENKPVPEVLLTVLHAGGKFDNDSYSVSGGLHGVGISVVNALSSKLSLKINRDNKVFTQSFIEGKPEKHFITDDFSKKTGTTVCFLPDSKIFTYTCFSYELVSERIKEMSYLNPSVTFIIIDKRIDKKEVIRFSEGISGFLEDKHGSKKISNICRMSSNYNNTLVDVALMWTEHTSENFYCFTNNIRQREGGTHLIGLKSSIVKVLNKFIQDSTEQEHKKIKEAKIASDDIREGVCGVVSVRSGTTNFSSQTKDKLVSAHIRTAVDKIVSEHLNIFFMENPDQLNKVLGKIYKSFLMREASKNAREIIKKGQKDKYLGILPGKLTNCQTKNPSLAEIFLVEGDSAGGTAKSARDRFSQAIMPLKGKILNVEKASEGNISRHEEIIKIVTCLGCGWGNNNISVKDLRYHKIIIMTDADDDGLHIRCLLLTLFFRYMKPLIESGFIYIAQPPLYSLKRGSKVIFLKDDKELASYMSEQEDIAVKLDGKILDAYSWKKICNIYQHCQLAILELSKFYPKEFVYALLNYTEFIHEDSWWEGIKKLLNQSKEHKYEILVQGSTAFVQQIRSDTSKTNFYVPISLFSSQYYKSIVEGKTIFTKSYNIKVDFKNKSSVFNRISYAMQWLDQQYKSSTSIKRYKGLGTLNSDQLWETTMDPISRRLLKINLQDAEIADKFFTTLMGPDVVPRKEFIVSKSEYVKIDV